MMATDPSVQLPKPLRRRRRGAPRRGPAGHELAWRRSSCFRRRGGLYKFEANPRPMQISARVNLIRSFGPGNARDDAQHVVEIDPVAGLEMPGYCLGTNSRQ